MKSIVYNEDCIQGMKRYEDNYFQLAVVDPPYGIGHSQLSGASRGSKFDRYNDNVNWDIKPNEEYFKELFRVSEHQIIWGANYFFDYLPSSKGMIIWDKVQMFSGSDFELAWTSFDLPAKAFRMSRVVAHQEDTIHPNQKNIKLYDFCFKYAKVTEGMKILDTHLGSGSSRISADKNKLDFVGFETDKQYFDAQEKRFNFHIQQQTLF